MTQGPSDQGSSEEEGDRDDRVSHNRTVDHHPFDDAGA